MHTYSTEERTHTSTIIHGWAIFKFLTTWLMIKILELYVITPTISKLFLAIVCT